MGELQQRMSSREFTEWRAYYDIAPFGDDWAQAAIGAWAAAQPWTKKKLKPEQFIPRRDRPRKSPEELEAMFARFERQRNQG